MTEEGEQHTFKLKKIQQSKMSSHQHQGTSPGEAIARIVDRLMLSLQNKSKEYKNPSLAALFMVNNVQYMVSFMICSNCFLNHLNDSFLKTQLFPFLLKIGAVERSENRLMLGRKWVKQHHEMIDQCMQQYCKLSWDPVVHPLKEALEGVSS
jgi:hypothetical protein